LPAIGASAAVMAVMMLYTMHYPTQEIRLFWFFPLEMRWVMLGYLVWDLHPVLLALSGEGITSQIGHAAHLGGLAYGFLYYKYQWRLEPLADRVSKLRFKRSGTPKHRLVGDVPPQPSPEVDKERVDQLLDKILQSGQASLTEEERNILRSASE